MNRAIRIVLLCALAFSVGTASLAQRRAANNASRKARTSIPQILCEGDAIPKGYVLVGYKSSLKCGDKSQVVIKKPDKAEIVCSGSPIPDGYRIANELSSPDCLTKGSNSSSNARSIVFDGVPGSGRGRGSQAGDSAIARAFASRASGIQVQGEGTVIRVLTDDVNGPQHQRFIVQLASGQTLLVSHNIDIAPRIGGLEEGDNVSFSGEYVWNAKGGVIHWTHHDPQGRHVAGWIKHNGKTFQ
ncbi:MAG TPA: DUF3465 domain-containing protein [Pyrinomonadaceae bacterium]|jgi:hypothetical protein|nr:DUF3465 domain-containing protein [Pyrinomonadaceae bacterium]